MAKLIELVAHAILQDTTKPATFTLTAVRSLDELAQRRQDKVTNDEVELEFSLLGLYTNAGRYWMQAQATKHPQVAIIEEDGNNVVIDVTER